MKLSYDICKELKDAGFPLTSTERKIFHLPVKFFAIDGEWYFEPTLEELIDECGKRFFLLRQNVDGTFVATGDADDEIDAHGFTPKEAVARLYIALHKTV